MKLVGRILGARVSRRLLVAYSSSLQLSELKLYWVFKIMVVIMVGETDNRIFSKGIIETSEEVSNAEGFVGYH